MKQSSSDPAEVLDELRRIRGSDRVHGGAWFAAAALAALVLASAVLYEQVWLLERSRAYAVVLPSWAGLPDAQRSPTLSYVFWFVGTPLTFALIALWYRRRERHTGIRLRWQWVVWCGLGVLVLLAALAAVPVENRLELAPARYGADGFAWRTMLSPLLPIAASAVALGVVERSRWLMMSGGWLAAVALWNCTQGMGGLPGWATSLLGGGSGPTPGGQLTLLGLHRPGPVLVLATLPIAAFAVTHAVRARRARR